MNTALGAVHSDVQEYTMKYGEKAAEHTDEYLEIKKQLNESV